MTFLCLCYYDQTMFDALKPDDLAALEEACKPHDEALRNSGRLFAQASLAFPQTARTVAPARMLLPSRVARTRLRTSRSVCFLSSKRRTWTKRRRSRANTPARTSATSSAAASRFAP